MEYYSEIKINEAWCNMDDVTSQSHMVLYYSCEMYRIGKSMKTNDKAVVS